MKIYWRWVVLFLLMTSMCSCSLRDTFSQQSAKETQSQDQWIQTAKFVTSTNRQPGYKLGNNVAISGNGTIIAAYCSKSEKENYSDNEIRVFTKSDSDDWIMDSIIKQSFIHDSNAFFSSFVLSRDGEFVFAGIPNAYSGKGVILCFSKDTGWAKTAEIQPSNEKQADSIGSSISVSSNGEYICTLGGVGYPDNLKESDRNITVLKRKGTLFEWKTQGVLGLRSPQTNEVFYPPLQISQNGDMIVTSGGCDEGLWFGFEPQIYVYTRKGDLWHNAMEDELIKLSKPIIEPENPCNSDIAMTGQGNVIAFSYYHSFFPGETRDRIEIFEKHRKYNDSERFFYLDSFALDDKVDVGYGLAISDDGKVLACGGRIGNNDLSLTTCAVVIFERSEKFTQFKMKDLLFASDKKPFSVDGYSMTLDKKGFKLDGLTIALDSAGNTLVIGTTDGDGAVYVFQRKTPRPLNNK